LTPSTSPSHPTTRDWERREEVCRRRSPGAAEATTILVEEARGSAPAGPTWQAAQNRLFFVYASVDGSHLEVRVGPENTWVCCARCTCAISSESRTIEINRLHMIHSLVSGRIDGMDTGHISKRIHRLTMTERPARK
jgi:hypothetical protein